MNKLANVAFVLSALTACSNDEHQVGLGGACVTELDCAPFGVSCKIAVCEAQVCVAAPDPTCTHCLAETSDVDCDDEDPCTDDACNSDNLCAHTDVCSGDDEIDGEIDASANPDGSVSVSAGYDDSGAESDYQHAIDAQLAALGDDQCADIGPLAPPMGQPFTDIGTIELANGSTSLDFERLADNFYIGKFLPGAVPPPGATFDLRLGGNAVVDAGTVTDKIHILTAPIHVGGTFDANNQLQLTDTITWDPIVADHMRLVFTFDENGVITTVTCGANPASGSRDISQLRARLPLDGSLLVDIRNRAVLPIVAAAGPRLVVSTSSTSIFLGFRNQ